MTARRVTGALECGLRPPAKTQEDLEGLFNHSVKLLVTEKGRGSDTHRESRIQVDPCSPEG